MTDKAQAGGDGSVTIVTQTQVRPESDDAFAAWQEATSAVIAAATGFLGQTVIRPSPPAQIDWVVLQRFANIPAAVAWLNSAERQQRVATAQPMLVGRDDVHLVSDSQAGALPAPVSAVIATRIKPGQETAYRAWEQRIAAAQSKAAGFQGYRFEPPIPGVQEDWLSILRFDTEAHLQAWLGSPARKALLEEAVGFTEAFHTRIARTGFDQWFQPAAGGGPAPPTWKQNMLVLLMLYPVVFLFGYFVQAPYLMGKAGLPFPVALFIANVASILLLNYLVPWTSARMSWWLRPADAGGRVDIAGAALVVALFAALVLAFTRFL